MFNYAWTEMKFCHNLATVVARPQVIGAGDRLSKWGGRHSDRWTVALSNIWVEFAAEMAGQIAGPVASIDSISQRRREYQIILTCCTSGCSHDNTLTSITNHNAIKTSPVLFLGLAVCVELLSMNNRYWNGISERILICYFVWHQIK